MFSSNNSQIGNDPISFYNHGLPISFDFENNQTSNQESHNPELIFPLSFLHFPSPFEEIFLEQPHDGFHHHLITQPEPIVNMEVSNEKKIHVEEKHKTMEEEQIQRKKGSKGDRHSKIETARGLRDRRMRLSLEVSKRFFGLQDMLGFDKASKTVEWLLNQAKDEVNQLERQNMKKNHCYSGKSASSTSECEGVSSLDEVVVSENQEQEKKRKIQVTRKSAFHPLAKECRNKARKRARERTKEKMNLRVLAGESKMCKEAKNHNLSQLGSWNHFETGEKSGNPNSLEVLSESKEHLGMVEDMAHVDMIFNTLNNSEFLQEHQFTESFGKSWETHNNHI